jgi:DNA invertase Pin-like site-specific DNA recombinase
MMMSKRIYISEEKEVIGYVRVSTDDQDVYKQMETIEHYAKRIGLKVTRFIKTEVSALKSISQRKLDFLVNLRADDTLICTETSR